MKIFHQNKKNLEERIENIEKNQMEMEKFFEKDGVQNILEIN